VTFHARDRDSAPAGGADDGHREGGVATVARAPGHGTRRPNVGRRMRLRPTVEVFPASDGHLYLLAGEDRHLRIREPQAWQRELISNLDGRSEHEMLDHLRAGGHHTQLSEVKQAIASLEDAGLLEDADDDKRYGFSSEELQRLDRQLRYFGDLGLAHPRAHLQRQLADSHVVILGLGGLGSWALQALACVGIGRITAVDYDRVELSNLSRQSIYGLKDLGRPKVECARRWLESFSPSTRFCGFEQRLSDPQAVAEVVKEGDLVLGLIDTPVGEVEGWINQACRHQGIALMSASQFPPMVRIGPLYAPDSPGCHACLIAGVRDEFPLFEELATFRRQLPSPAATFGPASALIGALLANEAVNHLANLCTPATRGCAITVDLRTLEMQRARVQARADCALCSQA
jgi:molybdopterin-synthase adenylyltransferase